MNNRVAKFTKIKKVALFDEPIQKLKKGDVLIAIKAVGICRSDIHYFLDGGLGSFKVPFPIYVGHEPSGVVAESRSDKFYIGDRVAVEPGNACKECEWCLKGRHNLCLQGTFMGANSQGAIADYVVVNESQLVKIPSSMSFAAASLLEPLGIALHAYNLLKPRRGDSVTIFGAGPIGLTLMSLLRKKGIQEIYMVDILPYRVAFSKKMGATKAFLYKDAVEKIKKLTKGKGTQYAFDAAGNSDAINGCTNIVSIGGKIGLVGIPIDDYVQYNPHKLRTKEVTLQNVRRSNQTLRECVRLYKNDTDIQKLITHEIPLEDVQKAFDMVSTYSNNVMKCVIKNK